jgi:hypothetical protein
MEYLFVIAALVIGLLAFCLTGSNPPPGGT